MFEPEKESVRLCEHIVRQAFGDDVCRVASTLLKRGRLNSMTLYRLSGLPKTTVLSSLVVLCRHRLVLSSGSSSTATEEMYEFDIKTCLLRLRWGRVLTLTTERMGMLASEIITQILLFGQIKLPEIIHACDGQYDQARTAEIKDTATKLVRARFLLPSHPEFNISSSAQIETRKKTITQDGKYKGEKALMSDLQKVNIERQATWELSEYRAKLREIDRVLITTAKPGKKKKSKPGEDLDYSLRSDVPLEVNFDRFGVLMRDELIVKAAEDRWNRGAAEVIRAILDAALDEHSELSATRTYTPVGVNAIVERIPQDNRKYLSAGMHGATVKNLPDLVRQYLAILSGEDVIPGTGLRFLTSQGSGDLTYTVELEAICVRLRANLMMDLVRSRLGKRQARVLATVAKAHHISEQTIRDCAMIPLKEARIALADLQKMSLIETSEIAKSINVKRTAMTAASEHHRWAMDLPRAYIALSASVYKTLGNILQRRSNEYERRSAAVARDQTAATRGGRSVLTQQDQDELNELDDVVRKLVLAEQRCELVVFILRDLPGHPTDRILV